MVCTSILHYLNMHMITVLEMQIHMYNTISNEMQCVESHSNSVLTHAGIDLQCAIQTMK